MLISKAVSGTGSSQAEEQVQHSYSAGLGTSCVHTLSLGTEIGLEINWQLNWAEQKKALTPSVFITAEKTLQHAGMLSQAHVHY